MHALYKILVEFSGSCLASDKTKLKLKVRNNIMNFYLFIYFCCLVLGLERKRRENQQAEWLRPFSTILFSYLFYLLQIWEFPGVIIDIFLGSFLILVSPLHAFIAVL